MSTHAAPKNKLDSQATDLSTSSPHAAFTFKRSEYLKTLNLTVEEYEHTVTGALHYHLASDNVENVFLVALRTVPMDHTGVAHILEHTALCGSKRFPVRDPFFMMIRRSMNTFMNAFTSSDWTAYPFASQNKKDFNNLLEVYLDAVFFSNLNELDFAQEGHRLEFSTPDDSSSELEYKGVVFNEMKGAMSSVNSYIWQKLTHHLFPETTYHYNSGGDPTHIPDLSYEQLKSFYKSHYHPSNAIFMTYGNIPAGEHQSSFDSLALKDFEHLDINVSVADERRYQSPIEVTEYYPLDDEDNGQKSHILIAWLLGKSTDLEALYKAQLLSSVLLDNSASPLLQVLETSSLGLSPSPLCGLEDSHREMSFICGLEGCARDSTDDVKALILDTLKNIANQGVDQTQVEAALHSLELQQREISGDSYPYGLELILAMLSTATHRGDPIELLDIDPVLKKLKEDIKDPNFIPDMIKQDLLDNAHLVVLTVHPDDTLAQKQKEDEIGRLQDIKEQLTDAEIDKIIVQTKALEERQNQKDDVSILPKVELSDVPTEIKWPKGSREVINSLDCQFYPQGTNGIAYQQIILPLPALPSHLSLLLSIYSSCLPELGLGNQTYLDIQTLQSSISGGVSAFTTMRSQLGDEQSIQAFFVLSGKGLYNQQQHLSQLLHDILAEARFDERQRIKELIQQIVVRREQSITSQGHGLAMGLAGSNMSPLAYYEYTHSGLQGIKELKALSAQLDNEEQLNTLCENLAEIHQLIQQSPPQLLAIADESDKEALLTGLGAIWTPQNNRPRNFDDFTLPPVRSSVNKAWLCNTQVNFCAKAYPTVPSGHIDAAALCVLGGVLRNGFLHKHIREQGGAYGGGASQDSSSASFRFFSYRDPRLAETLEDFDQSIQWLLDTEHDENALEESILGVISSLDKPTSPAGSAKQAYYNQLFGRSREQRAEFRQQILELNMGNLKEVAEHYLKKESASTGVISFKEEEETLNALGLSVETL